MDPPIEHSSSCTSTIDNASSTSSTRCLWIVCTTMFFIPLTITASAVLNPTISTDYEAPYWQGLWIVNAFMVAYSAFMTLSGALADNLGRKRCFVTGLAVFTAFSFVAAMAPSIEVLITARAVTGLGAASLTTAGSAMLASEFQGAERARAFTIFGTALGLGVVLGPVLAGECIEVTGSWRSFFAATGAPLALLCLMSFSLPGAGSGQARSIDWLGGVLFTASLVAFVSLLSLVPVTGMGASVVRSLLAGGVLLAVAFACCEARQARPIIDLSLIGNKGYLSVCLTAVFLGFGYISLLFYIPQFLSISGQMSPREIGTTLIFATAPCLAAPPIVARFRHRLSTRLLLSCTYACLVVGPLAFALTMSRPTCAHLAVPLLLLGSSFGVSLAFLDGAALGFVDHTRSGLAAGMFNTFRLGGEAVMIPVMGFLLTSFLPTVGQSSASGNASIVQGNLLQATGLLGISAEAVGANLTGALRSVTILISAVSLVGAVLTLALNAAGGPEHGSNP